MVKYCSECGSKNPKHAKFCSNCGHPFGGYKKAEPVEYDEYYEESESFAHQHVSDDEIYITNSTISGKNLIKGLANYEPPKGREKYSGSIVGEMRKLAIRPRIGGDDDI